MDHEGLVDAMVSLARTASADTTPEQLLARLVDVAAEHFDGDGVGVMRNDDGALRFVHATGPRGVDAAERLQELTQEGPCQDALLFGADFIVDDLRDPVQTAWPEFVQRALEAGFGSVVAVPLLARGRVWGTLDVYRRQAGTWRLEELQWIRLLAHTATSHVVMAADRDQARQARSELEHRSTHDGLTGLPNRTLLFDRLEHALHAARRHRTTVAVFFIDLDRFKAVNDTFGHAAGDTVLTTVANRLNATLRQQDTLARLAGDEFVLVCEGMPRGGGPAPLQESADPVERPTGAQASSRTSRSGARERVDAVTDRLRRIMARPIRLGELDLVVSASIGVALSEDHDSVDDLMADADAAMYRVKRSRDTDGLLPLSVTAHDQGTAEVADGRLRRSARHLERQLSQALVQEEFRVHYQPISDPAGTVHAVEALLRWQHPRYGLLSAGDFVDLATASGLIVGIGHWVVQQTCAQMARWQRDLGTAAPQTSYVNLTARELADPALTETLAAALRENELEPRHLGLELVESSFIDPQVLPSLHEQHRRGHPLSVDDFGTGYSSLSQLVELPVTMAKIDKSFVAGITHDPRRRALVNAVVTVANSLDLRVIAEGVETPEQARDVAAAGCHFLQGYHCGRPLPAEEFTAQWAGAAGSSDRRHLGGRSGDAGG